MKFHSILFQRPEQRVDVDRPEPPAFFRDLNLAPVIESITKGREEYRLKPFFYTLLSDLDSIAFRQEILRDLEGSDVWGCIGSFAQKMRSMREHLTQADKLYYKYQKQGWFLDAVASSSRIRSSWRTVFTVSEWMASYSCVPSAGPTAPGRSD